MPRWTRIAIPAVMLASSLALGFLYFTHAVTEKDAWKQFGEFWSGVDARWLKLGRDEMRSRLARGDPDDWETLVLRTALGRWRAKPVASKAYEHLMQKMYSHGWWSCPAPTDWQSSFEQLDKEWLTRRHKVISTADRITTGDVEVIWQKGPVVAYGFKRHSATVAVGSQIVFTYDAAPRDVPSTYVRIYWTTGAQNSVSEYRRRIGMVSKIPGAPEGRQRFMITCDLSWEPAWMAPSAVAGFVAVRHDDIARWNLVGVEPGDSPLLPLQ